MTERRPAPFLSAIIPTKDRARALATTLEALAAQTEVEGGAEIVVADNGSGDETSQVLAAAAKRDPRLISVRQPKPGPAAARNAAVAAASGEVLLLLGDDTAPADGDLLAAHAALHRAQPDPAYAVLGRLEWAPQPPPTEFMRWLDAGGPQFHYFELSPGPVDPSRYFYSSHLSLKRALFERAGGFDERFPFAAFEDTDIGDRLGRLGLRLEYHPELVAFHDHPTSLASSLNRMIVVGRSAALYNRLHPDRPNPMVSAPRLPVHFLGPLAGRLTNLRIPAPARKQVWAMLHYARYAQGYRQGALSTR